jgi:glyoxylate carboligase
MGADLHTVTEFEDVAISADDAPTAILALQN